MVYLARLLGTFTWQVYLARSGLNALGPRHGLPILRRWIGRWGASEAHSARPQHGTKAAHEPPGRRPVLPLSCASSAAVAPKRPPHRGAAKQWGGRLPGARTALRKAAYFPALPRLP